MNTRLDRLLASLREAPVDKRLDQLEPHVLLRLGAFRRRQARAEVWGWRAALAAVMTAVGVIASGAAAHSQTQEFSPFAVHAQLAPSTLLEDRT